MQREQNPGICFPKGFISFEQRVGINGFFNSNFEGKVGFGSIRRSRSLAAILGLVEKGRGRGNSAVIPFKFQGFCSKKGGFDGGREDGAPKVSRAHTKLGVFFESKKSRFGVSGPFQV